MTSIPKGVQFKTVKPQGFFQEYRDYYVTPVQTYGGVFSMTDIVRMQFNLQDWYIDPYESFIEAEVGLVDETKIDFTSAVPYDGSNKVQFCMMDGPSTSLINDFRLEVNSKEIERIREYDQVGTLLMDLNMYPHAVDQKDYEGYYSNKSSKTIESYRYSNDQTSCTQAGNPAINIATFNQNFNIPCYAGKMVTNFELIGGEPCINQGQVYDFPALSQSGAAAGDLNVNNISGYRLERMMATADYTGFRLNAAISTALSQATDTKIGGGAYSQIYNPSQYLGSLTAGNTNYGINHTYPSATAAPGGGNIGYLYCPESPKMQQIDGHNIFLSNLPTSKIINGKFQSNLYSNSDYTAQSRAYMQIPLLSGVLGVLIPSERWQLIPSSSLGNVNMEFRFNENAFFSYNDKPCAWRVNKFQLKLRLYRFDQQLMQQLKQQTRSGIQLHSQIFSMGPIYNIQSNVSVTNNWQINNGIPSIKNLFFWFLSQDYEVYPYARKNFKLSQNLTSMQLKIGSTYVPQNPIIGHAGNIIMNTKIPLDNSVYLSELHSSLNLLFDCHKHININKTNFAVNERPYDVTMDTVLGMSTTQAAFPKKRRMFLDSGFTLWNEMRCRGKAIYTFNLDMDKKNDDTMTGIDTTKVRPIELILKSDDPNAYPRQSTMYVMFLSDFIVSFGESDTSVDGAG